MRNYGRRLKRYFFLKREKLNLFGGVENILPNKIIGWIYAKQFTIDEIRLYVGEQLISKSKININRDDVNSKFKCDIKTGFEVLIPQEINNIDLNQKIRLVATSFINYKNYELKSINKNIDLNNRLKIILSSDIKGVNGYFDGLDYDNMYIGWAGKENKEDIISIWLRCEDKDPIELLCKEYRDDLDKVNLKSNSGFEIDSNLIPNDWIGKNLYCSFDKNGLFILPQLGEVKAIEKSIKDSPEIDLNYTQSKNQLIISSPSNLEEHWEALEIFNLELNRIEKYLNEENKKESLLNNKKKSGIIKRFLSNFN